jgi:hypothetical protein
VRIAAIIVSLVLLHPLQPGGGLGAQVQGFIDAGSGTMRSGSESPFGIVRIAPSLQVNTARLSLDADGDFAGHTEHGWQSVGHFQAKLVQPLVGPLTARISLLGGASRTRWGKGSAGWLGEARVQLASATSGLAIGLGSGHTFASSGTQPLSRIEAGGWSRLGRIDFGFWLKRTGLVVPGSTVQSTDGTPRDTLGVGGSAGGERRLLQDHYTDIEASLGWSRGNLALTAGAGRRIGKAFRYTSWHAQAQYQLTTRVALVASTGQFPVDVVSGLPAGGFTTLSMRLNLRDDPPVSPSSSVFRVQGTRAGFSTSAEEDGTQLILVRLSGAAAVELMGDFTDWTPVILVPGDDSTWRLRMRIPAGIHEVNVRMDGGPWQVPPGLTAVDDGFGGKVGRFAIE